MTWFRKPGFVCCVGTFAFFVTVPLSAQQGPPTVSANVVNTSANPVPVVVTGADPVPVVVTGEKIEELVFFRTGYQVPTGKRLLIDDVSVTCNAQSVLPHGNNQTIADFERLGISTTAVLVVNYEAAACPEPTVPAPIGGGQVCVPQRHNVGTAQTNGTNPVFQTSGGKPVTSVGAGRTMRVFAEQGGTLSATCLSTTDSSFLTGAGRLIDKP